MSVSRRQFLQTTSSATVGLPFIKHPVEQSQLANILKVKVMATNWGFDGTTDAFCAKAKGADDDRPATPQ